MYVKLRKQNPVVSKASDDLIAAFIAYTLVSLS